MDWSPSARSEKSKVAEHGVARLSEGCLLRRPASVASGLARLKLACSSLKWTVQNPLVTFAWSSLTACSSELCPESTGHARLELADGSLKRTLISSEKKLRVSNPFPPKVPILIFPNPKLVPNNVYRSYTWKYTQWCKKLEIKTSFHQNSTIHQTFIIFQQQQQFSSQIHK